MNPIQQILSDAADLLERDGWCRHVGKNLRGEYCALGAITASILAQHPVALRSVSLVQHPGRIEAAEHLADTLGLDSRLDLPSWNDNKHRTKEQVIAALRKAATL